MGEIRYRVFVFTSHDDDSIRTAHEKARQLLEELVSPIIDGTSNGCRSFFIAPDGSKEGWPMNNAVSSKRSEFADWLEENRYQLEANWVYLVFGDAEPQIVNHAGKHAPR